MIVASQPMPSRVAISAKGPLKVAKVPEAWLAHVEPIASCGREKRNAT